MGDTVILNNKELNWDEFLTQFNNIKLFGHGLISGNIEHYIQAAIKAGKLTEFLVSASTGLVIKLIEANDIQHLKILFDAATTRIAKKVLICSKDFMPLKAAIASQEYPVFKMFFDIGAELGVMEKFFHTIEGANYQFIFCNKDSSITQDLMTALEQCNLIPDWQHSYFATPILLNCENHYNLYYFFNAVNKNPLLKDFGSPEQLIKEIIKTAIEKNNLEVCEVGLQAVRNISIPDDYHKYFDRELIIKAANSDSICSAKIFALIAATPLKAYFFKNIEPSDLNHIEPSDLNHLLEHNLDMACTFYKQLKQIKDKSFLDKVILDEQDCMELVTPPGSEPTSSQHTDL